MAIEMKFCVHSGASKMICRVHSSNINAISGKNLSVGPSLTFLNFIISNFV